MADLTLKDATRKWIDIHGVGGIEQRTKLAMEAISCGDAVREDTTGGGWTKANGTTAAEARAWGLAGKTVVAGQGLTAYRKGIVDIFDLSSLAYDDKVYLSDTDGKLGTTAGTVSTVVGRVTGVHDQVLGGSETKVLALEFTS
jgi:hypothetical protein